MNISNLVPLLKHITQIGPPGCAMSVSHKGKTIFEHYEGIADIESGRAVDSNTVFRIFSNTKNITAVAVLMLYERGAYLLNDPVEKYLPFFENMTFYDYDGSNTAVVRPVTQSIRIKDLLTMCSGLTYGGTANQANLDTKERLNDALSSNSMSTMDFAKELSKAPLAFNPGSHWNYGYSHDILGALVEAVSGRSFGEFLYDEIFGPLNMEHTSFSLKKGMKTNLASLYRVEDYGLVKDDFKDYTYDPAYKFESGGGGLLSTLNDLDKFSKMLSMGGTIDGIRIIGRKTIELMQQNHLEPVPFSDFQKVSKGAWPWFEGYGYGLGVRTMVNCPQAGSNGNNGEFGWAGMAGTWLMVDIKEQLSACYMHQLIPDVKNLQDYCHPRIRNVIYAALD